MTELVHSPANLWRRPVWHQLTWLTVVVAALAIGIWGNWHWLVEENKRIETWMLPCVWLSELVACFWFLQYCLGNLRARARSGLSRIAIATLLLSLLVDLVFSIYSFTREVTAENSAVPVKGQIVAAEVVYLRVAVPDKRQHSITIRFQDRMGAVHQATHFFQNEGWEELNITLLGRKLPLPVDVKYDPKWPGRNWIAGDRRSTFNRLPVFFFSAWLFSFLVTTYLVLLARKTKQTSLPSEKIGPLLGLAIVLLMVGLMKLLTGLR